MAGRLTDELHAFCFVFGNFWLSNADLAWRAHGRDGCDDDGVDSFVVQLLAFVIGTEGQKPAIVEMAKGRHIVFTHVVRRKLDRHASRVHRAGFALQRDVELARATAAQIHFYRVACLVVRRAGVEQTGERKIIERADFWWRGRWRCNGWWWFNLGRENCTRAAFAVVRGTCDHDGVLAARFRVDGIGVLDVERVRETYVLNIDFIVIDADRQLVALGRSIGEHIKFQRLIDTEGRRVGCDVQNFRSCRCCHRRCL